MDETGSGPAASARAPHTANGTGGAASLVAPPGRPVQQDIEPHVEAWENFIALTKWSTIGIILILVLLALFLL